MSRETEVTGLLTERERKWIEGELDDPPEGSAKRQMKSRIKNRLKAGILDFRYLLKYLATDRRQRELIFGDPEVMKGIFQSGETALDLDKEFKDPAVMLARSMDAIGLFYLAILGEKSFEPFIAGGVRKGLQYTGWLAEVDVSIEVDRKETVEEVQERIIEEETYTFDDLAVLRDAGIISRERVTQEFENAWADFVEPNDNSPI